MNREALETLVIQATGRTDKLTLIRSAIDLAVREISTYHLWSDLMVEDDVTILTDALSVALASDVARVTEARVIDGTMSRPLFVRPKTWIISRVPDPTTRSSARPTYGYLEGQTLYVVPKPNADYTIRYTYFRLHPTLDTPTSELLIRHTDAAVAAYAIFWTFQSIEKFEEAKAWYATYAAQAMSAKKIDKDNSVVQHRATGRDENLNAVDYWLDPFQRTVP